MAWRFELPDSALLPFC